MSSSMFRLLNRPGSRCGATELYEYWLAEGAWFASRVAEDLCNQHIDPRRDHFFGFNSASLECLKAMRRRGVITILDQMDPAREEERLVEIEREKWPGWEPSPGPIPKAYWDRVTSEWEAADLIVVNSEWSKTMLLRQGVPTEKLVVVPLAYEARILKLPAKDYSGRLNVLWLGSVILRKGIPYLLDAARRLPSVHFTIAGPVGIAREKLAAAPENMQFLGRVMRHEVDTLFQQAHLFVLPTISDGFAITQIEAMAHGLPVVTTPNCGRVVTNGRDGVVVPAADGDALARAIATLDADRSLLREMANHALATAQSFDLPGNAVSLEMSIKRFREMRQKN